MDSNKINEFSEESSILPISKNKTHFKYNQGHWTELEHKLFLEALLKNGNNWKYVQNHVKTRTQSQSRSHAQKFFLKINKLYERKKLLNPNKNELIGLLVKEIFNVSPEEINEKNIKKIYQLYNIFHPEIEEVNKFSKLKNVNLERINSRKTFRIQKQRRKPFSPVDYIGVNEMSEISKVMTMTQSKYEKSASLLNDFAILIPNFSNENFITNNKNQMNLINFNIFVDKNLFEKSVNNHEKSMNFELKALGNNLKIEKKFIEYPKDTSKDTFLEYILDICKEKLYHSPLENRDPSKSTLFSTEKIPEVRGDKLNRYFNVNINNNITNKNEDLEIIKDNTIPEDFEETFNQMQSIERFFYEV